MNSRPDWTRVNDVFHQALDQAPEARAAWVRSTCGADTALADEVISLLEAHDRADAFIETPAAGRTIGPYRLIDTLGAGGMGIVWLAEDTRLGRQVALKALAPEFTADEHRRARLRREARAAAALTHPGIATIYALEDIDGHLYIASEHVKGETLREEIARGGAPPTHVIDTGIALARAVAAAHDRGIVHRDLKPENIIRTADGGVKILDFGLARFRELTDGAPAPQTMTEAGVAAGTPAYMSPEQIRAEDVDARSDLFSLGIVLYELATGAHPFVGADAAATLARILESTPTLLTERPGIAAGSTPLVAGLSRVIARCLSKRAHDRFHSAEALIDALIAVREGHLTAALSAGPEPSAARWWWQFHQGAACGIYALLLIPMWAVHDWVPGRLGMVLFLTALAAVIGASTLRLHRWFTLRSYPQEWPAQYQETEPWRRASDVLFVAALLIGGSLILADHAGTAALLVAAAVAVLISSLIIEPATTRAMRQS